MISLMCNNHTNNRKIIDNCILLPYNISNVTTYDVSGDTNVLFSIILIIRNISIPAIALIGLIGNILSVFLFICSRLKKLSMSIFLQSLAIVDSLFLVILLLAWYSDTVEPSWKNDVMCGIISYVSYVTSFLSIWLVVCFSVERFLAVRHPLRSKMICSVLRQRVIVLVLVLTGIILYCHALWTTTSYVEGSSPVCIHKFEYIYFLEIVTWVDTIITMLFPFCLILILNIKVLCTTLKFRQKRKMYMNHKNKTLNSKSQMRITLTLLIISFIFLFLNLPSHLIRIYNLILITNDSVNGMGEKVYFLQEIAQILYYTTYGLNLYIYVLRGKHYNLHKSGCSQCKITEV